MLSYIMIFKHLLANEILFGSRKFKSPRSLRNLDNLQYFWRYISKRLRRCWISKRFEPRESQLGRVTQRKLDQSSFVIGVDVTVPPMKKMRMHQGSAPSSCAPSSSSSTFCSSSSRVPCSSASPTSAHYVTLLSTVHICLRESPLSSRRPGPLNDN